MPLALSEFRLNLLAKYLCFAFPAIGIVLIWGYGGILSLGQGIFFGLGSYMMAMFLKLESTDSGSSAQALSEFFGSNLPDFMVWNSVEKLPWWWEPFHSFWFTLAGDSHPARVDGLRAGLRQLPQARRRRLLLDHHAGARGDHGHRDHRPAGRDRRRQRHHRLQDRSSASASKPRASAPSCTSSPSCCC